MGKGDRRKRKLLPKLAETPRPKKRGKARMSEISQERAPKCADGFLFIYAIEARGSEFVKIGVSVDPHSRMRDLQTANPYELGILYLVKSERSAALKIEAAIHSTDEAKKARGQGEWLDIHHAAIPMLFHTAAEAIGVDVEWVSGAPGDVEPEGFCQKIDRSQMVPVRSTHRAGRQW